MSHAAAVKPVIQRLLLAGVLGCAGHLPAAVIEGRVQLPAKRATAVVNKRYEIVTKGGALMVNPPVAVVHQPLPPRGPGERPD